MMDESVRRCSRDWDHLPTESVAVAVRVTVVGTSVGCGTTRVSVGEKRRESASVWGYLELSSGCGESSEWTLAIVLRCMRCLRR